MFPHVLWLGLLEGPSGYADETRGFLRALERAGETPAARALLGAGRTDLGAEDRAMLDAQMARQAEDVDVAVHHYAPGWIREAPVVRGAANVARTMFETDRIPRAWLPQLLTRDEVWVPSHAGAEAFERGGVPASRLRVIGGTLDFDRFRPGLEPYPLEDANGFVFLSNFEFTERKGWRQLLAAWARAFDPTDPVTLVLKAAARGGGGELRERVRVAAQEAARAAGKPDTAPVGVMTETLSTEDLARLYARADAYVLPSRGEGWGRPYMEAMACGLPTIASRFSGNLEFMSDETSWLVGGELVEVPQDHGVFGDDVADHRWFEPDIEELASVLAAIAGDPEAARAKAAGARDDLIARFGPDATATALRSAIEEVSAKRSRLAASGRSVVIRGPFGRHQSLGLVNDRLLDGLEAGGRRVAPHAHGAGPDVHETISVSHSWPPDFSAGALGPAVVILPWEFGAPPSEWVHRARADLDRVVVPSAYVRDGYVAGGMPPGVVEVVPNGVDLGRFSPDGETFELDRAGCVFLFVGGTIWRKGIDLLLQAWTRAFGPDDDVVLVIKAFGGDSHYRGQTATELIHSLQARDEVAPIVHLERHLEPDELPALYRAADVLVAPYRGEGFCLPVLEAMACGVPVVHTAIGPTSEFVPGDAGWAVDAERITIEDRTLVMDPVGEGYVHEVDIDALVATLREVAADPGERRRRGARAHDSAQAYGWDAAARRMEDVLAGVEAEALTPARDIAAERPEGRGTLVAYAPDWADDATWSRALRAWVEAVGPDDDVTLALCVAEGIASTVAERVMALLDTFGDDLPDLALHSRPDDDPLPLVAGADAVLLDDTQAVDPPARLHRRAARLITFDALPGAFKHPETMPTTRW